MDNIKKTVNSMINALFKPKNKLSLIPNWLSFQRAIFGPIIPVLIYNKVSIVAIISCLIFVTLSDFLDGKIARLIVKEETKEGALLDAVSDKIFSISLIIGLIPIIPSFICNLALEGATSLINSKNLSEGHTPKSNIIGKIKTWPLFISLALAYTGLSINDNFLNINPSDLISLASTFSIIAIPLEIMSTKDYLTEYLKHKKKEEVTKLENKETKKEINKSEKRKKEITKKHEYSLDKSKKNQVLVIQNDYTEKEEISKDKGRQKRIEL